MALIKAIVVFICGIIGAALSRVFAEEYKAWCPWIVEKLIKHAILKLPASQRERYQEEWRSHINEVPGEIGKIIVAIGFSTAAHKISSILGHRNRMTFGDVFSRGMDLTLGSALLVFLAPLLTLTAIAIKVDSAGPILLAEGQVGLDGRRFTMYRFRTVVFERGRAKAQTRLGRFLYKYALAQLPMLINLVRGDMTLVGPTPKPEALVGSLSRMIPNYERRLQVKPGITGLAQINIEAVTSVEDFYRELIYDRFYIRYRSLKLQLLILFRTLRLVFSGRDVLD